MNDRRPPRFPYVAALLCAGCVGMAGYLWMRYSYAWDVTPRALRGEGTPLGLGIWTDMYVTIRGRAWEGERLDSDGRTTGLVPPPIPDTRRVWIGEDGASMVIAEDEAHRLSSSTYWTCRVRQWEIDATASRFHSASIAGLVVGAMGVFVFAVALRHWLGERRRAREAA